MYAGGEGTKKNPTEAGRWQRKAIEQGYVPVQSDRDDELVSVRDRNGGVVGKFPLKELRAKAVAGSIDLESEMMWASGGPWILLNDLIPSEAERHRSEIQLQRNSPRKVLAAASQAGDYDLLKWLLAGEPDILKQGNEALILAIQEGHAACVRLLVTRGANLADAKVIDAACERGDATINRYLNPTNDKELAALFESASQGTRVVKQSAVRLAGINREKAALENQLKHLPKAGKDGIHIPKCPTCGSPDVERIALASKGLAAFAFGLFSIGYAGKTYECHNCRHKW